VQLEIQAAVDSNKRDRIITVFDDDKQKQAYFDHGLARDKYTGTDWEFLIGLDAVKYRRDQFEREAMVNRILAKAAEFPEGNHRWDFFLSHGQAAAGDQCAMLCELLEQREKPDGANYRVWYDQTRVNRNEEDMVQGVADSSCIIVFLSGDPNCNNI
jgi:hypothetical protein